MSNRRGNPSAREARVAASARIDMHGVEDEIGFALRLAQLAVFKDVIGGKTLVSAIDREKARQLLDTVKGLPSNATKRFPKKKLAEVLEIAKAKELAPMSVTTANSYMSAFVSLLDFAVAEHIIEKNPATGLRLASDGVKRKDKRLPFPDPR